MAILFWPISFTEVKTREKWPEKVANWPLFKNKSGHKNDQKCPQNGQIYIIFGVFRVKKAVFYVLWPFAHFYFYLIAKKK